jgi:phage virion morphogenesis protein
MIQIEISGAARIEDIIQGLNSALDTTEILDESGALLLSKLRQRYLAETDPEGKKWAPSLAAIKRKEKGRGGGTLYDSGRLFHSIQLAGTGAIDRFIGTDVPYGIYHQNGEGEGRRVFLGFADSDVSLVQRLIIKRIGDSLGGL